MLVHSYIRVACFSQLPVDYITVARFSLLYQGYTLISGLYSYMATASPNLIYDTTGFISKIILSPRLWSYTVNNFTTRNSKLISINKVFSCRQPHCRFTQTMQLVTHHQRHWWNEDLASSAPKHFPMRIPSKWGNPWSTTQSGETPINNWPNFMIDCQPDIHHLWFGAKFTDKTTMSKWVVSHKSMKTN